MKDDLSKWLQGVTSKAGLTRLKGSYQVRTSIVHDKEGWRVRVRVEWPGQNVPDLFVGPFRDEAEAIAHGQNVASLVRKSLGQEEK